MTISYKKLTPENISEVLNLQNKIVNSLEKNQMHFINIKSEKDFLKDLENENTYVLGVYLNDNLISQATASLPKNNTQREMAEYEQDYHNHEIAIYKTILVDPKYRSHGLMKKMLEKFEELEEIKNRKVALIQIAVENPASWINAMKHGMMITKVDKDPEDEAMVVYLKKGLQNKHSIKVQDENSCSFKINDNILKNPKILFEKMKHLNNSHIGATWDCENKQIIWKKENKSSKGLSKPFIMEKSYGR